MRIGVFPFLNHNGGGIYQYSLAILRTLNEWETDDQLFVLTLNDNHPIPPYLDRDKWEFKPLQLQLDRGNPKTLNIFRRIVGEGIHRDSWRRLRRALNGNLNRANGSVSDLDVVRPRPAINEMFRKWKLDLVFYAWPTPLSFETQVPFIMAIHDMQHRLQPEFPEVSANGEWESREYCFRNSARHATLLVADSEVGKEDILHFYESHVTSEQVKVLPFLPASHPNGNLLSSDGTRVRTFYALPERYLFYPAQFWPHKNHLRIVQALHLLRETRDLTAPIVFCGSHTGEIREHTFKEVMSFSSSVGLEKQIHYLGYVPDQDVSAIYAHATALVMPTFFGPTNIPILEAWAHGCPVLTSDIRGIREQVGNAALMVDPRSVNAIAEGIHRLWTDDSLCANLTRFGRRRLGSYTPNDFQERLIAIVEEAKTRVRLKSVKSHVGGEINPKQTTFVTPPEFKQGPYSGIDEKERF